jgi:signal transduction histidine kinase
MPYFKCLIIFYNKASLSLLLVIYCSIKPSLAQSFDEAYEKIKLQFEVAESYSLNRDSILSNGNDLVKGCFYLIDSKHKLKSKHFNEADSLLHIAKSLFVNVNCQKGIGFCHFYLGNVAQNFNVSQKVISSYINGIKYFDSCGYKDGSILSYLKLATYFSKNHNEVEAKKCFSRGQAYLDSTNNDRIKVSFYLNLAAYLTEITEADSALILYAKILDKYQSQLSKSRKAKLFNNIAANHIVNSNWSESLKYLHKSLEIKKQLKDTIGIIRTSQNLFKYYIELKDENEAGKIHKELSVFFRKDTSEIGTYVDFLHNEIQYYVLTNELDSIERSLPKYRNAFIQKENIAFSDKIIEMQKSFELKEKDQEIALLEKEDALNHSRLKTQNIILAIVASFLLILLVVGYLIERQRKELVQSRRRLLRQKEDISGMNEQLRVSNLAKDRILSVIGHDLRGPVGGLKELIELYMELPEHDPQDIQNLLKAAREASTSTYHLLENLLSWANSQRGEIVYNPVATPLLPLVKQTVQLLDSSINPRQVSFEYDIPGALVVNVDLNMLRTIIRNLVSNALKYSPEKGVIKIQVFNENSQLKFCVCDQGMGMTADETKDIFKKKETYFIGSEMTAKGTGLGLILCKEFVERHGGTIWIKSEKDVGTQVWFSIPHKRTNVASEVHLQSTTAQ